MQGLRLTGGPGRGVMARWGCWGPFCMASSRSFLMDGSSAWLCAREEVMLCAQTSVPTMPGCNLLVSFSWVWELPSLLWRRSHTFCPYLVTCGLSVGWLVSWVSKVCVCLLDHGFNGGFKGPRSSTEPLQQSLSLFWTAMSWQAPGTSLCPKLGPFFPTHCLFRQQDHVDLTLGQLARWMGLLTPLV